MGKEKKSTLVEVTMKVPLWEQKKARAESVR